MNRRDQEKLLLQFLEDHLGIRYQGCQSGFGSHDDLLLFQGGQDAHGGFSTLAVPISILLLPREEARGICQKKIQESEEAFRARPVTVLPTRRQEALAVLAKEIQQTREAIFNLFPMQPEGKIQ